MKKIFILIFIAALMLTACDNENANNLQESGSKQQESSTSTVTSKDSIINNLKVAYRSYFEKNKNETNSIIKEIDSNEKYLNNKEKVIDYYDNILVECKDICIKMYESALDYTEAVMSSSKENSVKCEDLKAVRDEIYKTIGNSLYEDLYNGFMKEIYSAFCNGDNSEAYDKWHETNNDIYDMWYETSCDIYEFWNEVSGAVSEDEEEMAYSRVIEFIEKIEEVKNREKIEKPTEKETESATQKPTEKPTEPVTEKPTEKPTEPVTQKPTEKPTEPVTQKPTEKPTEAPVSYSTNSADTVKNGNSGVYSYKKSNKLYDQYYIIDFDEGYVYEFCYGQGDTYGERVKIVSGDLNSVLIVTYHDGGMVWSNGLHFKYKNQPTHMVLEDNDHFLYDYYDTDLKNALRLKEKFTFIDF